MGSREKNFYNALAVRMGYADEAKEIQDLYLAKQHREAMAAVPHGFLDSISLLGGKERIAEKLTAYAEAGATTVAITPFASDRRPADRRPAHGCRSPRPRRSRY